MGRKSISQRLANTKDVEVKKTIVRDWAANWKLEQSNLIQKLGEAIASDDYDQLCITSGELKGLTEKRFNALPNVLLKCLEADNV